MRLFHLSVTSRRRWFKVGCFALFASSLACVHAAERPLTDADVTRYLPRLREEASAFTKEVREARETSAAIDSAIAERMALYDDMVSGKTDIAAWMRAQTEYAMVPAKAVYKPECSRWVTAQGAVPSAVFTFGKESTYRDLMRRAASGDEAARDEVSRRRGEEEMGKRSAAGKAMLDFVAGIVSFYRDHGFVEYHPEWQTINDTLFMSPDERVSVWICEWNPYCGLLPYEVPPVCSSLPTGPILELNYIRETPSEFEVLQSAAAEEKPDPEYERVKEALILAKMDAADPSQLEVEIPPDAPPEAKKELREYASLFAVRKANLAVYKRHEAALAPILEALLGETSH
jgi:hypothetical protein